MTSSAPRTRNRASGWTAERRAAFIAALMELGSAERAAVRVGLSASSAYRLRRQPRGAGFALAWDAALAEREGRLRDALMDRFAERHEPVYYRGRVVGERVIASDRLLLRFFSRMQRCRPAPDRDPAIAYHEALARLHDDDKFNEIAENREHLRT